MAGQPHRQQHVAHLGGFGVALGVDLHQQLGQPPGAHQRLLQILQLDVQQLALDAGRAQCRILALPLGDLHRQRRRVQPQQHFGKVVQQRRGMDHLGVVVHAVHREGQREGCAAMRTLQHLLQALQRGRVPAQVRVDRELRAEGAKEGRDAQQHQRGGDGLGVGGAAWRADAGHVRHQLQAHQRVVGNGLGQQVRVHRVFVRTAGLEQFGRVGQYRNRRAEEMPGPGTQVR